MDRHAVQRGVYLGGVCAGDVGHRLCEVEVVEDRPVLSQVLGVWGDVNAGVDSPRRSAVPPCKSGCGGGGGGGDERGCQY